jgi:hypothetical protein
MRQSLPGILFCSLIAFAFTGSKSNNASLTTEASADPKSLYDSIVAMDAAWEDAYNHCRVAKMDSIISEDLEFYHDLGGVMTSKSKLMTAFQENVCNKVTRKLKPGSIEVYGIKGYGAVEMGLHGFHNSLEPNAVMHFSKFVHIWKREHGRWRITRVISLH